MLESIPNSYIDQYKSDFHVLAQQKSTRLMKAVRMDPDEINGENVYFDRLGATTLTQKRTRNADTPNMEIPHSRRRFTHKTFHWGRMIDRDDMRRIGMGRPLKPRYAELSNAAFQRERDDTIIDALLGDATEIDEEGVTSPAPLPATQKIAVTYSGTTPAGTTNTSLTVAKLRAVMRLFRKNEVIGPDGMEEQVYAAVSADEIDGLLAETEVGSSDYNAVKPLVDGNVTRFMGIEFIPTERTPVASDIRRVPFWVPSAVGYQDNAGPEDDYEGGMNQDGIFIGMDVRKDKSYSAQIYMELAMGATRIEDVRVVEVSCAASTA